MSEPCYQICHNFLLNLPWWMRFFWIFKIIRWDFHNIWKLNNWNSIFLHILEHKIILKYHISKSYFHDLWEELELQIFKIIKKINWHFPRFVQKHPNFFTLFRIHKGFLIFQNSNNFVNSWNTRETNNTLFTFKYLKIFLNFKN